MYTHNDYQPADLRSSGNAQYSGKQEIFAARARQTVRDLTDLSASMRLMLPYFVSVLEPPVTYINAVSVTVTLSGTLITRKCHQTDLSHLAADRPMVRKR